MEKRIIETLADKCYHDALEIKQGYPEKAKGYFAISFGFNSQLERIEHLKLCLNHLERLCTCEEELKIYKGYGREMALFCLNLAEAVEETLKKI